MHPIHRPIPLLLALLLAAPSLPARGEPIHLVQSPVLSPDGERVAFSWRDDIWTAASRGGTARRLTTHPAWDGRPFFAPDGRRVAFASRRWGGSTQVFVYDPDRGGVRRLTGHSEGAWPVGWLPDGRAVLAAGRRDQTGLPGRRTRLLRVPLAPTGRTTLLFDAALSDYGVSPSPGGRRLLYTREGEAWWRRGYRGSWSSRVWLYDRDRRTHTLAAAHPGGIRWPRWLSDGRSFLAVSGEGGTFNLWHWRDGLREPLTRFTGEGVVHPTTSADGRTVLFRRGVHLWRLDLPGGRCRPLALHAGEPGGRRPTLRLTRDRAEGVGFSADGRQVAFVAGLRAWVMDRVLREPVPVSPPDEPVGEVAFRPDGGAIAYTLLRNGSWDLWLAEPADPGRPCWRNRTFRHRRLTRDGEVETEVRFSPDGKRLAWRNSLGHIVVRALPAGPTRQVLRSTTMFSAYRWSPDSRWLACTHPERGGQHCRNIWIVAADGTGRPHNVSMHPNRDWAPAWSPDGRRLAWVSRRAGDEPDLCWLPLTRKGDQRTPRDRRLVRAVKAMGEGSPTGAGKPKPVRVEIGFERIHERIRRIPLPGGTEADPCWSADGKALLFRARLAGGAGTWRVEVDPLDGKPARPRRVAPVALTAPRWLPEAKVYAGTVDGVPTLLEKGGRIVRLPFRVHLVRDLPRHLVHGFDQAWTAMRDIYYRPPGSFLDWEGVRRRLRPFAAGCLGGREYEHLLGLMLGSLNGSHLGYRRDPTLFRAAGEWAGDGAARPVTWHPGILWARRHGRLQIGRIVPRGPADRDGSGLRPGVTVYRIDGTPVGTHTDLVPLLTRTVRRPLRLEVTAPKGGRRTVEVLPDTYAEIRKLLLADLVRRRRALVERRSGGAVGYLNITAMRGGNLEAYQRDLYLAGHGRRALVIDLRGNSGGNISTRLLSSLCRPPVSTMHPRGLEPGNFRWLGVYPAWRKPVVLLVDQGTISDAELLAHTVKDLGRGRIVGAPTPGWLIYTSNKTVLDLGRVRAPWIGVYGTGGKDLEGNGVIPHLLLWAGPGELNAPERDRQLHRAVDEAARAPGEGG